MECLKNFFQEVRMRGFLTSGFISLLLATGAMAANPKAVTGTAKNDEQNLKELKRNNAILERQEESSTKALRAKQRDKYQPPGGNEKSTTPIFRQATPTNTDD